MAPKSQFNFTQTYISPSHERGNCPALDLGHFLEAHLLDCLLGARGELQVGEHSGVFAGVGEGEGGM